MGWLPDLWFPQKSHILVDLINEPDGLFLRFTVDPSYPTRWEQEPYNKQIRFMAINGLRTNKWRTVVSLNGDWLLILPDKIVPYAAGRLIQYGNGAYDFIADPPDDRQDHSVSQS